MGILKSFEEAGCVPEIVSGHPGRLRTVLPFNFELDDRASMAICEYLLDFPFLLAVDGDRFGNGLPRSCAETLWRGLRTAEAQRRFAWGVSLRGAPPTGMRWH